VNPAMDHLRRRFDLADPSVWRGIMAVLFMLGVAVRVGLWHDLEWHPILRQEEWPRTMAAHWTNLAAQSVERGDWSLTSDGIRISRRMAEAAPPVWWEHVMDHRLPRGAGALWLLMASYKATGGPALFLVLTILAGATLAPAAASIAARISTRGIGVLAGVLVATNMSLTIASVRYGPWIWEVAILAAALWCGVHAFANRERTVWWLGLGVTLACGLFMRPVFAFGLPLVAIMVARDFKNRPPVHALAALVLPVILATGALASRNAAVGAPKFALPGMTEWELVRHWNANALRHPSIPPNIQVVDAAGGSTLRAAWLLLDSRADWGTLVHKNLRYVLGARDVPQDLNADYVRRRSDWLRFTTLSSDVAMVLLLAGVIFGTATGRLPVPLVLLLFFLMLNAFVFSPMGDDRGMIVFVGSVIGTIALGSVLESRAQQPVMPFVWLVCAWAMLALLRIDDSARGTRLRYDEFVRSNHLLGQDRFAPAPLGERNLRAARRELDDYGRRERFEQVYDLYERVPSRQISPGD